MNDSHRQSAHHRSPQLSRERLGLADAAPKFGGLTAGVERPHCGSSPTELLLRWSRAAASRPCSEEPARNTLNASATRKNSMKASGRRPAKVAIFAASSAKLGLDAQGRRQSPT